jgi:hypothetical protein
MATLATGLEDFDTGRGNETEEVAFSQLNYLYEMMKEESGKLRIQNKELRIKNADLGDKVANYDKIRMLHESDLREQFARNTVQMKKELEASSSRVEELGKELAKKTDAVKAANQNVSALTNEIRELREWKDSTSGKHSKVTQEIEAKCEKEIRRMKIEWARAVKTKIANIELKHKQDLYLLKKAR